MQLANDASHAMNAFTWVRHYGGLSNRMGAASRCVGSLAELIAKLGVLGHRVLAEKVILYTGGLHHEDVFKVVVPPEAICAGRGDINLNVNLSRKVF
jgi:hypothetical protein